MEKRKTLIVVDMQNDFVSGSLGTKEAQAIVEKVMQKIQKRKAEGWNIIYTKDTHFENYLKTQEGKNLPYEHCIKGTWGWEIVDGLLIPNSEVICKKSFGYIDWNKHELGEEIELIGLCTGICVISNALIIKATYPEAIVSVDQSCCACVTPQSHKNAVEAMKLCQIIITEE